MSQSKKSARYFIQFEKRLARFLNKLAGYIEDPSVDNTHHVRTSFRRVEASYSIFPNSVKTCSSKQFLLLGKRFFRLNSAVRDSDIMLEKLKNQEQPSPIIKRLRQIRAENLEHAIVVAQELAQLPVPQLHNKKLQLDKHLQYKVDHRISNIQHFIPLIQDDEENIEELHTMRKQAKKLFYLLELDNDPADSAAMKNLRKLRTLTGDIHDCDVTITFLNEKSSLVGNADELIHTEQCVRHDCYEKLLFRLDKNLWQPPRRLT